MRFVVLVFLEMFFSSLVYSAESNYPVWSYHPSNRIYIEETDSRVDALRFVQSAVDPYSTLLSVRSSSLLDLRVMKIRILNSIEFEQKSPGLNWQTGELSNLRNKVERAFLDALIQRGQQLLNIHEAAGIITFADELAVWTLRRPSNGGIIKLTYKLHSLNQPKEVQEILQNLENEIARRKIKVDRLVSGKSIPGSEAAFLNFITKLTVEGVDVVPFLDRHLKVMQETLRWQDDLLRRTKEYSEYFLQRNSRALTCDGSIKS